MISLVTALEQNGFEYVHTGGNHYCLSKSVRTEQAFREVMITEADDCTIDEDYSGDVLLCLYDINGEGEALCLKMYTLPGEAAAIALMAEHLLSLNTPLIPYDNRTVEGVQTWLAELFDNGLLWHMDDSPADVFEHRLSAVEIGELQTQQDTALAICREHGVDIFDLYPGAVSE